jgi:serine/threonine-protein kinase
MLRGYLMSGLDGNFVLTHRENVMQINADTISEYFQNINEISHIATGGQKSVFKGKHDQYNDIVIKAINNPKTDQRIKREIEIITQNNLSNVPKIYEYKVLNINNQETLFIIEQYISGNNLRVLLQQKGTFRFVDAVAVLHQLLSIIVELEKSHLVHRDIKPENVLFDNNSILWLLDFGIARHLDMTSITATEEHFGPHTLGYAAPEQYRNIKAEIDSRADLFSVGIVFYELLTGENPYVSAARSPLDIIRRIEQINIPKLDVNVVQTQEMADFIYILMAKYPSRRPVTARQAFDWFNEIRETLTLKE